VLPREYNLHQQLHHKSLYLLFGLIVLLSWVDVAGNPPGMSVAL